jgi:cytochrome d ubiquinol oxidase subunit II
MGELPLVDLTAAAVVIAMAAYVIFGGADFGGGVWDLFAMGPRAARQRALIADTIGPIWEANHVWLILVVVILFTGFPAAYARLSVTLHIPLTLMLVGIVLRGSAFTFRSYDSQRDDVQRRWSRIFSIASLVTPILLGIVAGTVATGTVAVVPGVTFTDAYVAPWTRPLPLLVGLLTLVLFAFLAATYLTVEAEDAEMAADFRQRAIISGTILFPLAATVLLVARDAAPALWSGLVLSEWAWGLHLLTAIAAVTALTALVMRRFALARIAAASQAVLIIVGWARAQYPYIVPPDLTLHEAAAPPATLGLLVGALTLGSMLLFPSLWYLFRVFRRSEAGER